jgi:tRNA A37 methylthiotransferase MiaB
MVEKYTKKPVVIEAIQFNRSNWDAVKEFTNNTAHTITIERRIDGKCTCIIPTLEGQHIANENDYIIKGVKGEFYPCKPDVFEMTYNKTFIR